MFATRNKKPPTAKTENTKELTAGDKSPEQPNPIWQSLAIQHNGWQTRLAGGIHAHEEQADTVAHEVFRSPTPSRLGSLPSEAIVHRKCDGCAEQKINSPIKPIADSPGKPLDTATREFFEPRFGYDLRQVRVHTDEGAATSAKKLNALAYTVGRNIVFGSGQYAPNTRTGSELLAHELTHVTQQARGHQLALQRQPANSQQAPPQQPRQDFVFIMGQDRPRSGNPFYTEAERYFRAHVPAATFVTNLRTLDDVLTYIANNVVDPIGNLYIVSHANEDGTLSFALNAADQDTRLSLPELRSALHPAGGGPSVLTRVQGQVDAQTRIRIKGCDIGRTPGMVELIDEAFGGQGTVTAPTHEQSYGNDPTLAAAERRRVHDEMMAEFSAGLPAVPPVPAPVNPRLRGAERAQALADRREAARARQQAMRERRQAISAEEVRIRPEVERAGVLAGRYESFSGPMFQRPGTNLFTAAELRPEVDRLYGHLNDRQRRSLVEGLVAPDRRTTTIANRQGTFRQRGQRAYRLTPQTFTFTEPRTLAEANRALAQEFRAQNFRASALRPMQRTAVQGGTELTLEIEGRVVTRGAAPSSQVMTFTFGPVPDDAEIIAQGRDQLPNPDRYDWRVEERHNGSGRTTRIAIAERVVAYLHHGSLDPAPHSHFTRPEDDPDFFATSTFAPPASQAAQVPTANPVMQPKLTVSQASDPYEREADAVADRVMRMQNPEATDAEVSSFPGNSQIFQPKCKECDDDENLQRKEMNSVSGFTVSTPTLLEKALSSPSEPLGLSTRSFMEDRLKHDFRDVRVHTNTDAARSAESLNAHAYTVGRDLVFAAGQYQPDTTSGKKLLAHELSHTIQQSNGRGVASAEVIHRQPKGSPKPAAPPPPVAGGNVLYIGMNNFKPEVAKLKQRFGKTSVKVTTVTLAENEKKTRVDGKTFNLTDPDGIKLFAKSLSLDAPHTSDVEALITGQSHEDRDDLAHVVSVYAATEADKVDRMSRVVLSGHSYGTKIYNEDVKGAIYFDALVKLATIFPTAAAQTKHLLLLACLAAEEDLIKNQYTKAFPSLQTFWGYTNSCPTGSGAVERLSKWADITDVDPTKLDMPPSGQANWAMGVYQSDDPIDAPALMSGLRKDEATFNDYFAGVKVDPDNHSGFLFEYYRRARTAAQHTSEITGADHDYVQLHADQSFRLRFWPAMVSKFWKKNATAITKGYGSAKVPKYESMSRKDALAAIAKFDSTTTATGAEKDEAARLLKALKDLDVSELNDNWLTP